MVAWLSGWIAAGCVLAAGLLPLTRAARGAQMNARLTKTHMTLGIAVSALAFAHVLAAIPSLGEPAVVAGGMAALAPAVAAFFVLVAHTGVGLQLWRSPVTGTSKTKHAERARKRRLHRITATLIVLLIAAHVGMLRIR